MEIQSLSLCVPASCPNRCKFCVSHMHREKYLNQIEKNMRFRDLYLRDLEARLEFCRENGCNTLVLTGEGEPLFNLEFLDYFAAINKSLKSPFRWIELQTSGVTLDEEKLRYLRNTIRVSTISLSLSDLFSSKNNYEYNETGEKYKLKDKDFITSVCSEIKKYDFNLRLSLNMTDAYNDKDAETILDRAKMLGVNQITFRLLFTSENNTIEDQWIRKHRTSHCCIDEIRNYIRENGRPLEVLPSGMTRYSVQGISVVLDEDCMATEAKNTLRYLILRPNCKLYSKWDDEGSLIF